jgi:hypothetical protein
LCCISSRQLRVYLWDQHVWARWSSSRLCCSAVSHQAGQRQRLCVGENEQWSCSSTCMHGHKEDPVVVVLLLSRRVAGVLRSKNVAACALRVSKNRGSVVEKRGTVQGMLFALFAGSCMAGCRSTGRWHPCDWGESKGCARSQIARNECVLPGQGLPGRWSVPV